MVRHHQLSHCLISSGPSTHCDQCRQSAWYRRGRLRRSSCIIKQTPSTSTLFSSRTLSTSASFSGPVRIFSILFRISSTILISSKMSSFAKVALLAAAVNALPQFGTTTTAPPGGPTGTFTIPAFTIPGFTEPPFVTIPAFTVPARTITFADPNATSAPTSGQTLPGDSTFFPTSTSTSTNSRSRIVLPTIVPIGATTSSTSTGTTSSTTTDGTIVCTAGRSSQNAR